jgi:hypothetical protein
MLLKKEALKTSDPMKWEKILRDSVKDGQIKAVHLKNVPVLKNCDNWKIVEVLGWIDYEAKSVHYRGILVHLKGNLFFVKQTTFDAVREYLNLAHVSKIEVVQ